MTFRSRPIHTPREPLLPSGTTRRWALRAHAAFLRILPRAHTHGESHVSRVSVLKRAVTVLLTVFLALLLLAGLLRAAIALRVFTLSSFASFAGAELPKDEQGFTNMLLLGMGDTDHDGVDLTDTMMVASLDPKSASALLLSLPRDLYVTSTARMGTGRINSLYRNYKGYLMAQGRKAATASQESMKELAAEIGAMINLPIHGVAKVNFSGFEQAIDAIGGIDLVVQEDIVDPEYPGPNYTYETFSINRGPQHLDGATALKYARSRHTTSDFSRSARQQQIIAAAAEKLKSSGILRNLRKLNQIYAIVSQNLESTFSLREMLSLAVLGRGIDHQRILSYQLSDESGYGEGRASAGGLLYAPPREQFEGASVLLPASIPTFPINWKQIHVFSELVFQHRNLFLPAPRIAILNAKAPEGAGRRLSSELSRFGFSVVSVENFPKDRPPPSSSFVALAPASPRGRPENAGDLVTFLSDTLHLSQGTPDQTAQLELNGSPDVLLILGKDFSFRLLQDLVAVSPRT